MFYINPRVLNLVGTIGGELLDDTLAMFYINPRVLNVQDSHQQLVMNSSIMLHHAVFISKNLGLADITGCSLSGFLHLLCPWLVWFWSSQEPASPVLSTVVTF